MNITEKKILDAVIQKAEALCPDSLELIGIYGSFATGDVHEKSDLDLLILIRDAKGWQLAEGFILADTRIGYDLYCTTWEMLQSDAQCKHAHLSKLMDAKIVYVKNREAVPRLDALRQQAADILASEKRYNCARSAMEEAKKAYADCFLTDSLSRIRTHAGLVIHSLSDALMLLHGRYFRRGVKRTFQELAELNLPFDMEQLVLAVIRETSADGIRSRLTALMRCVQGFLQQPTSKEAPAKGNLAGTYEEMVSNWRNKMQEAAERQDLYASFMNMVAFQLMLRDVAAGVAIPEQEIMDHFNPNCLEQNRDAFDTALEAYLENYGRAGIPPNRFPNADSFVQHYLSR